MTKDKITIGQRRLTPDEHFQFHSGQMSVRLDASSLIYSRALIQANSGGGKTGLLRVIAEQVAATIPTIIIDKEGEFYTLREKIDLVLVGVQSEGADVTADVRSAGLLARKLIELGASAVIDLSALKSDPQQLFVKNFLESLMELPRKLWHPTLIMIDEAHLFCMDAETEILTAKGWQGWKDTKPDDLGVGFDLTSGRYQYEPISRVIIKRHAGEMVRLKSDGLDSFTTLDHRVVLRRTQRAKGRYKTYPWTFCEARRVPSHIQVPSGGAPTGEGLEVSDILLRVMGWVITDGCFTGAGKNLQRPRYLSISQSYSTVKRGERIAELIRRTLSHYEGVSAYERPARASHGKRSGPSVDFYLGKRLSSRLLYWLEMKIHRIPREILRRGSPSQLRSLYAGLMEGDGTAGKGNQNPWCAFYAGLNEGLADDVQELCLRLGINANKRFEKTNRQWTVQLTKRKHHTSRKPFREHYEGLVWDITIPSGAFVARRNGKVFVTGNCPERSMGESESTDAVIDLMTRGRKRGFGGLLATTRLSKLHKNAADANNIFIGRTVLDVDQTRAGKNLGMKGADILKLRDLETREFYAYGPDLDFKGVEIFRVADAQTSMPKPGAHKSLAPPKASHVVLQIADKLKDIEQEAEVEIRDLNAAKAEISKLKRDLRTAKSGQAPREQDTKRIATLEADLAVAKGKTRTETRTVEKRIVIDKNITRLEALQKDMAVPIERLETILERAHIERGHIAVALTEARELNAKAEVPAPSSSLAVFEPGFGSRARVPAAPRAVAPPRAPQAITAKVDGNSNGDKPLPKGEREVLAALIQYPDGLERLQIGVLTGHTKRSTRDAYIYRLSTKGYVIAESGQKVQATQEGIAALPDAQPLPTGTALQEYWLAKLPGGEDEILKHLIAAYPSTVNRDTIGEATGYEKRSTRDAYIYRLSQKQLVTSTSSGVRASDNLF